MESSELLQCKKYLRSTLIANKGGIRVSDLSRQYYQSVGEHIPYSDFGFKTLESFLISVPDVCQLTMNGQKLMATVVTSTATAHIARMIGAQKGSKSNSKKVKSLGRYSSMNRPNLRITRSMMALHKVKRLTLE